MNNVQMIGQVINGIFRAQAAISSGKHNDPVVRDADQDIANFARQIAESPTMPPGDQEHWHDVAQIGAIQDVQQKVNVYSRVLTAVRMMSNGVEA